MKSNFAASLIALFLGFSSISVSYAAEKEKPEKPGSLYVQCDGNPNNLSGAESLARGLADAAVIGLFIPRPEQADPSKRKFGEEGVAACQKVLSGEKPEKNVLRRIKLRLGLAIHKIEASKYQDAIDEVAIAKEEAAEAGLIEDPFFVRSMGISFNLIKSAAEFRLGDLSAAKESALASLSGNSYNLAGLVAIPSYSKISKNSTEPENQHLDEFARLLPLGLSAKATRFENSGDFAAAAKSIDSLIQYVDSSTSIAEGDEKKERRSSFTHARSAINHSLSGNIAISDQRAKLAKEIHENRIAEGKDDKGWANAVELLDLLEILKHHNDGETDEARRKFGGRSNWLIPSAGIVSTMVEMLQKDADVSGLHGLLKQSPDAIWESNLKTRMAKELAADKNNKNLFRLSRWYVQEKQYTALAKKVWRVKKSKILNKKFSEKLNAHTMFIYEGPAYVRYQAFMLHAALLAKDRGEPGFVISPFLDIPRIALVRFGAAGTKDIPAELFLDADHVISELRILFPDPETLKARRMSRKKRRRSRNRAK